MPTAIQALCKLAQSKTSLMARYYDGFYKTVPARTKWREEIKAFLDSTMDEPRVQRSQLAAHTALHIYDVAELLHLRRDVLKREVLGNIAYSDQRDHTAHTFNNWLLGWWLVENSNTLKQALMTEIASRGLLAWRVDSSKAKDPFHNTFGDLWQAVSLLHDIGYILEGAVTSGSLDSMSTHVKTGALLLEDFFRNCFLFDSGIRSEAMYAAIQERFQERLPEFEIVLPRFREPGNLPLMAQELAAIDPIVEELCHRAYAFERADSHLKAAWIARGAKLRPSRMLADVFDVWSESYQHFGHDSMAERIQKLRAIFRRYVLTGIDDGPRVLDHAICSGLIVFHNSTLYYLLHMGLEDYDWAAATKDGLHDEMRELYEEMIGTNYHVHWWFAGVLWACAAAGIHNVLQAGALDRLALDEDPLAYLGVLVDALQHWDRYSVARGGALGVRSPLEGNRVELDMSRSGIPTVIYRDKRRAESVVKELDRALMGWNKIVEVT